MRITVLDGDPRSPGSSLDRAIEATMAAASLRGDTCERLRLAPLKIHQCVGCFDCWLKTPGQCRLRDEGSMIVRAAVDSDLLVFASPMRMGFTSSLLKRASERLLPFLLPELLVWEGECRHPLRYGRPLDIAVLVEGGDSTPEELQVVETIYRRVAKNVYGKFLWFKIAEKEAPHALDHA